MASWDQLGELANVGQLVGFGASQLIGMIVRAAATARLHKKNCRQFAQHLKLIGNLLEQLKISELKSHPETREPLEHLEDALRRSYVLVSSCQDRSFLYLLAMGWNIVNQFRKAQSEIDSYLKIIPLIALVDNARVWERLAHIERDEREYIFDDEDKKAQDIILNPDPSNNHTVILKKTLSCSYPNLHFDEALQKENEKLQLELQRSQRIMDIGQCQVIQHLIGVTEAVANSLPEKCAHQNNSKKTKKCQLDAGGDRLYSYDGSYHYDGNAVLRDSLTLYQQSQVIAVLIRCLTLLKSTSKISSGHDLITNSGSHRDEEWNSDLLGCCSEPILCFKTFFFPCGTFSKIASVTRNRHISEACNDLMAYSLVLSCFCYTCCARRKLRKMLNIKGGLCDDFLSHLMCCCCALIQEWREVETRGILVTRRAGTEKTETCPPLSQYMES